MNNNHHWADEAEARSEIKELVGEYYRQFKKPMTEKVFNGCNAGFLAYNGKVCRSI